MGLKQTEKFLHSQGPATECTTTYKMRENRPWDNCILLLQTFYQFRHVLNGIKTHTMHTCIQLNMYREVGDTLLFGCMDKGIQQSEAIDLRLQIVLEERPESAHFRVHNHDIGGNARITERNSLISNGNSQIIYPMILQYLCHLNGPCTIGIRLTMQTILVSGFRKER